MTPDYEFELLMRALMKLTDKSREELFDLYRQTDRRYSGLLPASTVLRIVAVQLGDADPELEAIKNELEKRGEV